MAQLKIAVTEELESVTNKGSMQWSELQQREESVEQSLANLLNDINSYTMKCKLQVTIVLSS